MCPRIPKPDNFPTGHDWVPLVMQPVVLWVVFLASREDSTSTLEPYKYIDRFLKKSVLGNE